MSWFATALSGPASSGDQPASLAMTIGLVGAFIIGYTLIPT